MTTELTERSSYRDVLRRLGAAQKGHARGAPAYSVYINRRVGRVLAAFAYRVGWTPNQVTVVSAVHTFSAFAVLLLARPTVWSALAVALLLVLGYAWDSADGQVARLRGGGSIAGEWLDHFVDALKISSLHLAVLIALYRFVPELRGPLLLIPIAYSVVATVTFFGMILNALLKGAHGVVSTHARGGGTLGRSLLLLPTDFGLLCLVFLLWAWPHLFLVAYGAMFVLNALFLIAASRKWFREMRDVR